MVLTSGAGWKVATQNKEGRKVYILREQTSREVSRNKYVSLHSKTFIYVCSPINLMTSLRGGFYY